MSKLNSNGIICDVEGSRLPLNPTNINKRIYANEINMYAKYLDSLLKTLIDEEIAIAG